jgi:hypothetical protein
MGMVRVYTRRSQLTIWSPEILGHSSRTFMIDIDLRIPREMHDIQFIARFLTFGHSIIAVIKQ